MAGAAHADPDRPRRGWAPEAWRLRCALRAARERLPYATTDARLLDGVERWVLGTGLGRPVPGPWWALALALVTAAARCLADAASRRLVAPWVSGGATEPAAASAFKPLDLDGRVG